MLLDIVELVVHVNIDFRLRLVDDHLDFLNFVFLLLGFSLGFGWGVLTGEGDLLFYIICGQGPIDNEFGGLEVAEAGSDFTLVILLNVHILQVGLLNDFFFEGGVMLLGLEDVLSDLADGGDDLSRSLSLRINN